MSDLVDRVTRIGGYDRPRQEKLAIMAEIQHNVVGHWQLLLLGFTRSQIQHWIANKRLFRVFRGVYAAGSRRLEHRGRWMAAVLACGREAVLSHTPAAALWELRPRPSGPIDVTISRRSRSGQRGIRVHNVRHLHLDDHTVIDGIPVTSLHRTLLDYAEVAPRQQLRLAIEAADRLELVDTRKLDALIARSPGRRGIKPLRSVLAEMQGPAPWTQSELERQFLAFIRERGFPEPAANVLVEGALVDFFWPVQRVVVEADSWRFHKSRSKFESDRARDAKLQAANHRVIRVTQGRIQDQPDQLDADLRRLISASA